jgi:hypothetical protein
MHIAPSWLCVVHHRPLERSKDKKKGTLGTPPGAAHFLAARRFFVGDAGPPTGALPPEADSCLRLPSCSLVGLVSSAESAAILPPSFSHRSSIFFFRRFLAIGSGITMFPFYCSFSHNYSRVRCATNCCYTLWIKTYNLKTHPPSTFAAVVGTKR